MTFTLQNFVYFFPWAEKRAPEKRASGKKGPGKKGFGKKGLKTSKKDHLPKWLEIMKI